jgi:hypothetical protein
LSQLATARKSGPLGAGEKAKSEILSVGGSLSATSDLRSPRVGVDDDEAAEPKRVDMITLERRRSRAGADAREEEAKLQ